MLTSLVAVALGGSAGALLRFAVSGAVYQLLGRGFPYGTLAVNLIGSFLLGLLTESLLQSAISRPGVLTGLLGSFTTFSTFALETVTLFERGAFLRALGNVLASIGLGLVGAWAGLYCGRWLFLYSALTLPGLGWPFPLMLNFLANGVGAFVLGLLMEVGFERWSLRLEYRSVWIILLVGSFASLSSLHIFQELFHQAYAFQQTLLGLVGIFAFNLLVCAGGAWGGFGTGRRL